MSKRIEKPAKTDMNTPIEERPSGEWSDFEAFWIVRLIDVEGDWEGEKMLGEVVGSTDGMAVGHLVGLNVGAMLGPVVGDIVGWTDGMGVGDLVGLNVGAMLGPVVGDIVGSTDGMAVGDIVGLNVGAMLGPVVGDIVGWTDGMAVGDLVGKFDGRNVGKVVGDFVGRGVGLQTAGLSQIYRNALVQGRSFQLEVETSNKTTQSSFPMLLSGCKSAKLRYKDVPCEHWNDPSVKMSFKQDQTFPPEAVLYLLYKKIFSSTESTRTREDPSDAQASLAALHVAVVDERE
jgi:hypothetical protein